MNILQSHEVGFCNKEGDVQLTKRSSGFSFYNCSAMIPKVVNWNYRSKYFPMVRFL